jgi:hypothetical protein
MSSALREVFARFGVDFNTQGLDQGNAGVTALTGRLQSLGEALTGGAIVLGARAFVQQMADMGGEIDDTRQVLGLTVQGLQEWRYAAERAGVSSEQLTPALQAIRRNAAAAAAGGAGMAADFRRLGVSLKDEAGNLRGTDDLLRQGIEDPTARAAIAMRLMGESGARLVPLLAGGAPGIDAAAQAFRDLGGGMSDEAVQSAAEYGDAVQDLDTALLGLKSRIAVYVLPFVTRLVGAVTTAEAAFSRATDRGALLEATMITLGTAAAAAGLRTALAWAATAAPFILLGALVGGLVLIIEDIIVGLNGGRSALADFGTEIDAWAMSATGWLEPVAGAWLMIRDAIRAVVNEIASLAGYDDFLGLYQADVPTPAQQQERLAAARRQGEAIRAQREAAAAARADGGVAFQAGLDLTALPAFGGGGTAAAAGVIGTLGRPPAAPQVTQTIGRIEVNAPGGDPEVVRREATRAVLAALQRQADDTLDTMTQGT